MKILEQAKKTLESLEHAELVTIYNMMLSLKQHGTKGVSGRTKSDAYKKARNALKSCTGNLSDDISRIREDRL